MTPRDLLGDLVLALAVMGIIGGLIVLVFAWLMWWAWKTKDQIKDYGELD